MKKVMGSNHHFFHCMYKSVHVKRNILLLLLLLKRWIRNGNVESISNIVLECGGIYATP
ncbi:hypothetical protein B4082_5705 [Bacillus cereus]|uniref:Uncharacterized protein n=1 Tax=Bacillus cereus TaxID=1396 RepID=A0A164BI20_BACCE|nr:hypothetical protein B4082_5705 [Bacillus cereus]